MTYRTNRISLKAAMLAGASLAMVAAAASAQAEPVEFKIDAQDLGGALTDYGIQSGQEIYFVEADISGVTTKGLNGTFEPTQALNLILNGSDIPHTVDENGTILVGKEYVREANLGGQESSQIVLAQVEQSSTTETPKPVQTDREPVEDTELQQDTIVVTGSNIRGLAQESSPVFSYTRDDILASGASTAQDFIQDLPQNFGGGSNADLARGIPSDANAAFNGSSQGSIGSSVNLRGLGSGSTLVLLNGQRVAPSSGIGDFVDISLIPVSAIERVDVLTDGASSIYGADAVAGVLNFVLRDDFEGVETSLRYGSVTEGDLEELRASLAAGTTWDSGNALFVYEYFDQSDLSAEDRSFSEGAPLPTDLLPSVERHSVIGYIRQELSEDLEVFGDVFYSQRDSRLDVVNLRNGPLTFTPETESFKVSAGLVWNISENWFFDASGNYSVVDTKGQQIGAISAERDVNSELWTIDAKVSGDLFELPGGTVQVALGGQYRAEDFLNDTITAGTDRFADRTVTAGFFEAQIPIVGENNSQPGINRLELNLSGRIEDFSDFGSTSNPKIGLLWEPVESLRLRGSYSTSFNPPPLGRVGANDSNAANFRSSFTNTIFGLTSPDPSLDDAIVIVTGGTALELDPETSTSFTAGFDFDKDVLEGQFKVSATWYDVEFEDRLGSTPVPDGRIQFDAQNIAFLDPDAFPPGTVIFNPTEDQIRDVVDNVVNFGARGDDPFQATVINNVGIIRNIAETRVSGIDFDFEFERGFSSGDVSFGLGGSYLLDYEQTGAPGAPTIDLLNTLYNPVDLKIRGRAGYTRDGFSSTLFLNYIGSYSESQLDGARSIGSWTTADLSLAYSFENAQTNSALSGLSARLAVNNIFDRDPPSAPGNASLGIFGFDPTNASPLGRFISLGLTKRF